MTASSKIYANAVAKYDEGRLLDEEKLRRITEAPYHDAVRMLYDYGYGEGVPPEEADAEKLAAVETNKLISFVLEYAQNCFVADLLLLPYIYNDVKAAYKSRFVSVPSEAFYGAFDTLTEAVKSGEYSEITYVGMLNALAELDSADEEHAPNSFEIDTVFNRAMYLDLMHAAKKTGKRAKKYVIRKIDTVNLLTAFRCRKSGAGERELTGMLIDGGSIEKEKLTAMLTGEPETVIGEMDGEYEELIRALMTSGDMAVYERDAEDRLMASVVKNRDDMLSFDPFVGYFFAKRSEIATVKMVLTCVKNGATDEIKRRLRKRDD